MATRVQDGDLFSIPVGKGFGLFQQVTHLKSVGAMIRVLDGVHVQLPRDLETSVSISEGFITFFPLTAALEKKVVSPLGRFSLPQSFKVPVTFRIYNFDSRTGKRDWWITDGKKDVHVGELSKDQKKLPILETINAQALVEMILRGRKAEDEI